MSAQLAPVPQSGLAAQPSMSEHAVPSPPRPVLQVHVKLPAVFAHAAFVSQLSALVEHSSMSVQLLPLPV